MKKYLFLLTIIVLASQILLAQDNSDIKDEIAIKKTALDYAEGYYDGDGDRMGRAIHPDLNKVFAITLPQTGENLSSIFYSFTTSRNVKSKSGLPRPGQKKFNRYYSFEKK